MGHWGTQPWENDSAADWFDKVAEQSQLLEQIRATLALPLEQIDEIRAAAHLLLQVSNGGIGNAKDLSTLARGAVFRLSEAIEARLFEHPDFTNRVIEEIARLRKLFSEEDSA